MRMIRSSSLCLLLLLTLIHVCVSDTSNLLQCVISRNFDFKGALMRVYRVQQHEESVRLRQEAAQEAQRLRQEEAKRKQEESKRMQEEAKRKQQEEAKRKQEEEAKRKQQQEGGKPKDCPYEILGVDRDATQSEVKKVRQCVLPYDLLLALQDSNAS
jgi:ATPase subunit of ABC transporter with duplicated ATPase domains